MTEKTLRSYDFGELAAESDDQLINYFVVTPVAETILTKKIGTVLGRKGSGKTALFRQAEELLEGHDLGDVQVIRLNMDDHAWGAFADFQKLGLSVEHAATVSWELALLLQLAAHVAAEPQSRWSGVASNDALRSAPVRGRQLWGGCPATAEVEQVDWPGSEPEGRSVRERD